MTGFRTLRLVHRTHRRPLSPGRWFWDGRTGDGAYRYRSGYARTRRGAIRAARRAGVA